MRVYYLILCALIFVVVLSSGCVIPNTEEAGHKIEETVNLESRYRVVSIQDDDGRLCSTREPSAGFRVILIDNETGENLTGEGWVRHNNAEWNFYTDSNSSNCVYVGDSNSTDVVLSLLARGYSPKVLDVELPKNKLITLEVPLLKSCTGELSCLEKTRFFSTIEYEFGIKESDIKLDCMECMMGREGFIKARGVYLNKTPFEVYYHWGLCTSGGNYCGWSMCFTSYSEDTDELFESVKNKFCSEIYFKESHDEHFCESEEYDKTEEVRRDCFAGKYEEIREDRKTLAIKQTAERCTFSVHEGKMDCLKN